MKSGRKTLNYSGTNLHTDDFRRIVGELERDPFEVVRFINCNLRDEEAELLAETIKQHPYNRNLKKIKYLDLRENHISAMGAAKLDTAFKSHPQLKKMDLRDNKPTQIKETKESIYSFVMNVDELIDELLEQGASFGKPAPEKKEEAEAQILKEARAMAEDETKATEEVRIAAEAKAAKAAKAAEEARLAEEVRLAKTVEEARLAEETRIAVEAKAAKEAKLAAEAKEVVAQVKMPELTMEKPQSILAKCDAVLFKAEKTARLSKAIEAKKPDIVAEEPLTPKESEKVPTEMCVDDEWVLLSKAQFWKKSLRSTETKVDLTSLVKENSVGTNDVKKVQRILGA